MYIYYSFVTETCEAHAVVISINMYMYARTRTLNLKVVVIVTYFCNKSIFHNQFSCHNYTECQKVCKYHPLMSFNQFKTSYPTKCKKEFLQYSTISAMAVLLHGGTESLFCHNLKFIHSIEQISHSNFQNIFSNCGRLYH